MLVTGNTGAARMLPSVVWAPGASVTLCRKRGATPVLLTLTLKVSGSPTLLRVALLLPSTLHSGKLPMTKSESVAVGDCDERVSARKEEKQPCRPRAVRSTPSSRNSPCAGLVSPLLLV